MRNTNVSGAKNKLDLEFHTADGLHHFQALAFVRMCVCVRVSAGVWSQTHTRSWDSRSRRSSSFSSCRSCSTSSWVSESSCAPTPTLKSPWEGRKRCLKKEDNSIRQYLSRHSFAWSFPLIIALKERLRIIPAPSDGYATSSGVSEFFRTPHFLCPHTWRNKRLPHPSLVSGSLLDWKYTCSIWCSCATSSGVSESFRALVRTKCLPLLPLLSGGLLDLAYTCSIWRSCATSSGVSESLRTPPPTLKAPFKEKNKQKSQEIKKQFRYKYILVYKNIWTYSLYNYILECQII